MNLKGDILVLGGGAAGFFAAVNAARLNRGLRIALVEKSSKVLSKVLVSGGGRCNVTHHCLEPGILVGNYPRGGNVLRQVFARWGYGRYHPLVWSAGGSPQNRSGSPYVSLD
ncbi:MAG: NAD(P)/FAD-dependent oxidoreductase [Bacteroidota bacterium]